MLIENSSALPKLSCRKLDTHKGTYGRILCIGGSYGMAGAIALTGMAALRSGAGLVRLAVPKAIVNTVASFEPCYTVTSLPEDDRGRISKAAYEMLCLSSQESSVIALGPGMGQSSGLAKLVSRFYRDAVCPMVVDADALNALAVADSVADLKTPTPRVLTPHPGEFKRLFQSFGLGTPTGNRETDAQQLAQLLQAVVVLKGHRTIITNGEIAYENTNGNPGMATGGTGDVLTGVIAALLAQGLSALDAARLGVYLHGLAGDLAAKTLGQISLIARDLLVYLPEAFREVPTHKE